ncbi:MAG: carbohydrate ABC transporter permease [Bacillota bacterium]
MSYKFKHKFLPYLLLIPSFIVIFLFIYYPMFKTFEISFHKTLFMGTRSIYVGIENFLELLQSEEYRHSFFLTFSFSFTVVAITMPLAFIMSTLANQKLFGGRIFRTALIWPYALSPAIAGTIWLFIFNPTVGIVNYVLGVTFNISPDWVSSRQLAYFMVVATAVWKQLGYNVVFFLAGLQNVPGELVESAQIDGANVFQRYWKIVIPIMSPTIFFLLTMNLIYSFFGTFGMIDVMTQGGPVDATNILIYNLYQDAFRFGKTGFAASQSIILFIIVTIVMIIQFKVAGRRVHYAG